MRDSNSGMVEILEPEQNNGVYSSKIIVRLDNQDLNLRFAVTAQDFFRLKSITTYRPFENTGVGLYRYFFAGSYVKNHPSVGLSTIQVRVEQLKMHKQFPFEVSIGLTANLLWFGQIHDRALVEQFLI